MTKLLIHFVVFVAIVAPSWQRGIPLSVLNKISQIEDPEVFMRTFWPSEKALNETTELDSNRTLVGGRAIKRTRTSLEIAKHDPCSPRLTTVTVPQDEDPGILYWPMCTKIQRCGGCCSTDAYECTPTKTSYAYINVLVSRYQSSGSEFFANAGTLTLPMIQHDECEPQCRVKSHDCTKFQVYDDNDCSCKCTKEVTNCPEGQVWRPSLCRCACKEIKECGDSSLAFSHDSCTCELHELVGNVDLDKLNATNLRAKRNETKKVETKPRRTIPIPQPGKDEDDDDDESKVQIVKVSVQHKVQEKKPAPTKLDCSKHDCPPMWKGVKSRSGKCTCAFGRR